MKNALSLAALLMMSLAACGQEPVTATATAPQAAATASAAQPAPAATGSTSGAAQESTELADVDGGDAALERIAALPEAGKLPTGRWTAGTHYRPLVPSQPTNVAPGKVEVVEVFWYGCPHCYSLEPFFNSWLKNKPANIEFVRIPVIWSATHRGHARLFYTLQSLGKLEALHSKVFDEIQKNNKPLVGSDDAATLKAQQAFAKANGISEADYAKAFNSFTVLTKLQQADDLTRRYRVDGVPTVVINGKYVSDVGMAGSQANLISLINDLAASEKRR